MNHKLWIITHTLWIHFPVSFFQLNSLFQWTYFQLRSGILPVGMRKFFYQNFIRRSLTVQILPTITHYVFLNFLQNFFQLENATSIVKKKFRPFRRPPRLICRVIKFYDLDKFTPWELNSNYKRKLQYTTREINFQWNRSILIFSMF